MADEFDLARQVLADALELAPEAVPDTARLGEPPMWDSLAHMRLILAIEVKLGHELDPLQAIEIESLGDVASLLQSQPVPSASH